MTISAWLNNSKVQTSFVPYRGCAFLVYVSLVGTHRVVMIEEVQSNIRKFPKEQPDIESSSDMDKFVQSLMDEIIDKHFANH